MITVQRVIFFISIVKVANIQCSIFGCLPFKTCQESLEIETLQESSKDQIYNPLYLIGKHGFYELALPRAPVKTKNDEIAKDELKNPSVKIFFTNKQKLIYACPKILKSNFKEKVPSALSQQEDINLTSNSDLVNKFCTQKVEPMMRNLKKSCYESQLSGSEFYLYEVGFKKPTWHKLYTICHNTRTKATLYAIHTLYGESVRLTTPKFVGTFREVDEIESVDESTPNEITDKNLVSMNEIFKKESVEILFEDLLGRSSANSYFQENHDYLAKGHLVPDADMAFIPWKNATYLYSNVTPMWQILNNGVWKTIENQIRKFAKETGQNLTIYTGVYETLRYKNKDIFLGGKDTGIMPVPLYLWKVVHNEEKNQAIAFIVINDPYQGRNALCENKSDICSINGWANAITKKEPNKKRRFMHCCTVEQLRESVPYAPHIQNAEILQSFS